MEYILTSNKHEVKNNWGGSNPIFAHGKMCVFPFFPIGENGKKSIWKEREKYSFPSLSIYFFPHFFPWEKMGKDIFFHRQKWGWTPPPIIVLDIHFKNILKIFLINLN